MQDAHSRSSVVRARRCRGAGRRRRGRRWRAAGGPSGSALAIRTAHGPVRGAGGGAADGGGRGAWVAGRAAAAAATAACMLRQSGRPRVHGGHTRPLGRERRAVHGGGWRVHAGHTCLRGGSTQVVGQGGVWCAAHASTPCIAVHWHAGAQWRSQPHAVPAPHHPPSGGGGRKAAARRRATPLRAHVAAPAAWLRAAAWSAACQAIQMAWFFAVRVQPPNRRPRSFCTLQRHKHKRHRSVRNPLASVVRLTAAGLSGYFAGARSTAANMENVSPAPGTSSHAPKPACSFPAARC